MFILGLGTAVPRFCYSQEQCWTAFENSPQFSQLNSRARTTVRKVFSGNNGIETRHLALERLSDAFLLTPDVLHQRFSTWAPRLAAQAALRALDDAKLPREEIDALLVSTCTGYLCPGLTSYVIEELGLRPETFPLDLVGQGCGAALPNLTTAQALIRSGRCHKVLSICVEVCSAAFYVDNDLGVLISACLFGDGAGAAVLGSAGGKYSLEWMDMAGITDPATRDLLRFEQKDGMLRNILSLKVPGVASNYAGVVFDSLTRSHGLKLKDIQTWIWHSGGREVLKALQQKFDLSEEAIQCSAEILRRYGNLSSASVYFILEETLRRGAPNGWWWVSSFGAGFSCYGALLKKGTPD